MLRWIGENFFKGMSIVSAVLLIFVGGMVVGTFQWGPAHLVVVAKDVLKDLKRNAGAYFQDVPTQYLMPNRFGRSGVEVSAPDKVQPGVTFVTGLFGRKLGARLYAANGELLHEWPINFFSIAAEEMAYPFDALIHGDILYENGDFVANFDGRGIVRSSACGEILWQNRDRSHHSIDVDDNGDLWTPVYTATYNEPELTSSPFEFDAIARFDANTGEKLEQIDLVQALIKSDLVGLALANSLKLNDMIHLNDAEVLSAEMADAFPMFEAGDIALSSRNYSQIWVLDGKTHTVKWFHMGAVLGPHDPDFQPDGTITIFDNRPGGAATAENGYKGHRGGSRIVSVDPATGKHTIAYASDSRNTFYTAYRGKHQVMENGNILITETDAGRVFEVTPDGEVVWSFINGFDDTQVGWVMKATKYPESFGDFAKADCPQ